MTQKPGLMTRLAPATRLGLGLALAGVSMGAMAQTPQATLADATACVPKQDVEKTAQGETTYYVVCIKQLDGTRKEVRYTKSVSGAIMPPPVSDGKLLDGSGASGDEGEDRRANRKIIGKYDKDKQIVLAMTDPGGIVRDAERKVSAFTEKVGANTAITQQEFFEAYFGIYIFSMGEFNDKQRTQTKQSLNAISTMAKKFKYSDEEIENMKQKAEAEAQRRWREVTRSLD